MCIPDSEGIETNLYLEERGKRQQNMELTRQIHLPLPTQHGQRWFLKKETQIRCFPLLAVWFLKDSFSLIPPLYHVMKLPWYPGRARKPAGCSVKLN